ncbi:MAG TPA: hypothetical protein VEC06_10430 [Paucimonas sp.]|nr:hypothetical protein [Paucimonas sp.]
MSTFSCSDLFPAMVCAHRDPFLYLLPAAALALLFRALVRRASVFLVLYLAGTVLHELAHLLAAAFTNAKPVSFSILPQRRGNGWILGSVRCANIRWYNGIFVGLAPIAVALVPFLVAAWRTRYGLAWEWRDAWIAALLAPQFMSCWPSAADLKIAARSWPLVTAAVAAGMMLVA